MSMEVEMGQEQIDIFDSPVAEHRRTSKQPVEADLNRTCPSPDIADQYMEKLGGAVVEESAAETLSRVAATIFDGFGSSALSRLVAAFAADGQPGRAVLVPANALISAAPAPPPRPVAPAPTTPVDPTALPAVCAECRLTLALKRPGRLEDGLGPLDVTKPLQHVVAKHLADRNFFQCSECDYACGSKALIRGHVRRDHQGKAMQACPPIEQRKEIFERMMSAFSGIKLDLIFHRLDSFDNVDTKIQKLFS